MGEYSLQQVLKIRNENYAAGQKDERDRIIKLLMPMLEKAQLAPISINDARGLLIAIKGESK